MLAYLRKHVGAALLDGFFNGAARMGKRNPNARPELHGVEVEKDIPFYSGPDGELTLDIYRPQKQYASSPAVLYAHGGSFRILSKDTHWVMGLAFAKQGYTAFVFNYRLAPAHPFPAALIDACRAYLWLVHHGEEYGADISQLVVAGESAGANLTLALSAIACFPRPEPWAQEVFDSGVFPKAIAPACGILQVSDVERFVKNNNLAAWVRDRLLDVETAYVGAPRAHGESIELADPLLIWEGTDVPKRSLPPCFIGCGTKDILLEDSRRLAVACRNRGVPHELRTYLGQPHAFHAFAFATVAKQYWRQQFAFLRKYAAPVR